MSEGRARQRIWATLITDKSYVPGCLVLLSSLKHYGTKYQLVVMVLPCEGINETRLPQEYRDVLTQAGCILRDVDWLVPAGGGYTGEDTRFVDAWTKMRAFGLSEYERVVLIDSDMLTRRNMDELFDVPLEEGWIAACHACTCNPMRIPHYPSYWIPSNCGHTYAVPSEPGSDALCTPLQPSADSPQTFHTINSGIVVLAPTDDTHSKLVHALHKDTDVASYGFADQDFLTSYFKHHIKFLGYEYNAIKPMRGCHSSLWKDEGVRNVHYIFQLKPWNFYRGSDKLEEVFQVVHGWWWDEWERLESEVGNKPWWGLVTKQVVTV